MVNFVLEGITAIERRFPGEELYDSPEIPIFIFASCWRSGSTLLQRLCMCEQFMWGEPFGQADFLEQLAAPIRRFSRIWPPEEFLYHEEEGEPFEKQFCANLYPDPSRIRSSYRALLDNLFASPNLEKTRWGAKFVRNSAEHAAMLRWIYPNCKLVFLIRNPYECLHSYARWRSRGVNPFDKWPDYPLTVSRLAEVWSQNTQSFLDDYLKLDARIVRYENLFCHEFQQLESYLGFDFDPKILEINPEPQSTADQQHEITFIEYSAFSRFVEPIASQLGYQDPKPFEIRARTSDKKESDRICVLVPVGHAIEPACEKGLREAEAAGIEVRRVYGYSAIDQARNAMASQALADGYEELMWIDSDIGFSIDDITILRKHNLPIVCGLYPKKNRRELACHTGTKAHEIVFGERGGLINIRYAGAGFMLARKEVYETIVSQLDLPLCNEHFGSPIVPYYQPMVRDENGKKWYLAEDYAFCERVYRCEFKLMADTMIRLHHVGKAQYSWEDAGLARQRFKTFRLNLDNSKELDETQ